MQADLLSLQALVIAAGILMIWAFLRIRRRRHPTDSRKDRKPEAREPRL